MTKKDAANKGTSPSSDSQLSQVQEEELLRLVQGCADYRNSSILKVECLVGDASSRRYFRVLLARAPHPSVMLMIVNDNPGPVGGGIKKIGQDESFYQLSAFFLTHGIPVPKVLAYSKKSQFMLVEDLGKHTLRDYYEGDESQIGDSYGQVADRSKLFQKTVDILSTIQKIELQPDDLPAQRSVSIEKYIAEAKEFSEFLLKPLGLRESEEKVFDAFAKSISETIRDHPRCLCHFDFGAQNIVVAQSGDLHVLDFQDACLLSRARDPYSLLNDRDMDSYLGEEKQEDLLQLFFTKMAWPDTEQVKFRNEYREYGTHWDLRVSGRFSKLATQAGKERYGQWIPGTLRRLARRLPGMISEFPGLDDLVEITARLSGEFRETLG